MRKIKDLIKKIGEIYRMIMRIKNCIETEGIKDDNEKKRTNMEKRKRILRHRNRRSN
jgi:succinate dehydrogenase/fumarate reductase-like Fe-S protein